MEENAKKNTKCIDVYGNIGLRRISSQRTAQTLMRSTTRWVDVWDVVQSRLHIAQHTDEMKQHLLHVWHGIYQSIIDKYRRTRPTHFNAYGVRTSVSSLVFANLNFGVD